MSLIAKKGGDFIEVEPGSYVAICYRVIDLGTQHGTYKDEKTQKEIPTERKQVMITWEFPTELIQTGEYAGQPFSISDFYTISLDKKSKLRPMLESWRGRAFTEQELGGFDLKNILGKPCMINIIAGENRNKISAVTPVPKGFIPPAGKNPQVFFDIDAWDDAVFKALPEGIQKMICQSDEFKKLCRGQGQGAAPVYDERNPPPDDDIPF